MEYHVINTEEGDEMVVCGHCMMSMAEFGGDWMILDSGRDSEFDKTIERCEHIKSQCHHEHCLISDHPHPDGAG